MRQAMAYGPIERDQCYPDTLTEALMILQGLTALHPTIEHLRALDEHYECRLIKIANDIEQLKRSILK